MVRQEKIGAQGQILTILIAVISIVAYCFPEFSDLLVYERQSILSGELWRLFTAPLVHFSKSHLFWDILVFGAAGFAIAAAGFRCFWLVCIFAVSIPSFLFLFAFPAIERYGGLSALATGAAAYFFLCSAYKSKKNRLIWICLLAFISIKIIVEATMGVPLFAQSEKIPFQVLSSAHILGYLGALITIMWIWPNITLHRTPKSGRL